MSEERDRVWKVGVIGMGLMGRRMLGDMAPHASFECAAGFDSNVERLAQAAKDFGCEPCVSLDALLERPDLDCVYVATPPASHVELAHKVLEHGKPLFLEKPLAVDLDSARELVQVARSGSAPCAINFPFATLPGTNRMRRELADGTAGKPIRAEIVLHFSQWPRTWHKAGAWLSGDREGGFLREVFSHFAYLTQRFLGPLQVDSCTLDQVTGQGESRVQAGMYAGDVPVALTGGAAGAAPDFNQWTLFCEHRCYRVENWGTVSTSTADEWVPLEAESGESRGAESQLDELAKMLAGDRHVLPSLADGLGVMETVEGLLRAGS